MRATVANDFAVTSYWLKEWGLFLTTTKSTQKQANKAYMNYFHHSNENPYNRQLNLCQQAIFTITCSWPVCFS